MLLQEKRFRVGRLKLTSRRRGGQRRENSSRSGIIVPMYEELIEALTRSDEARVAELARSLAEDVASDPPALYHTLNLLGYHNRLALINEVMALAWPQVQEAATYSGAAVEAYAGRATDHLLYAYLAETADPDASDPALQARLERYFPVDVDRLEAYLGLLAGRLGRRWVEADFVELDTQKVQGLMLEFLGYAHRQEIPYARAHLVRDNLPRYFLDRKAGNLYPKEDVAALLRSGRRPRTTGTEPEHPLVPDAATLENFLQKLGQTVTPQPYVIAAILALLPTWLQFLETRGLIQSEQRSRAKAEVETVEERIRPLLATFEDPVLA